MVSKWQYQEKKYVLSNQFHCLEKFLAESQILKGLKIYIVDKQNAFTLVYVVSGFFFGKKIVLCLPDAFM